MENKPNRIIWHHSADGSSGNQFEKINRYHRGLGFPKSILGFYGGYHVLIEKDGTIMRYRADNEIGAHDKDENINTLGICLAGNLSLEHATERQIKSFRDQLLSWMSLHKIPAERIDPHRMGDSTECPGKLYSDDWARLLVIPKPPETTKEILQDIINYCQSKLDATR